MKVKVYVTGRIQWEDVVDAESEDQAAAKVEEQLRKDYPDVTHLDIVSEEVK